MKLKSYSELQVWQQAHELTLLVFRLTEKHPRSDQYGIVSQVRRSSSSVAANIAEGFGRGTTREFLRCLQIARGELEETRYFMLLSKDLGRISAEEFSSITAGCDSTWEIVECSGTVIAAKIKWRETSRQPLVTRV